MHNGNPAKMPAKKPTKKQIGLQVILSIILVWMLVSFITYAWKLVADEDREELWLQAELNRGQYGACVHDYNMYRGEGKTAGKEFDKFQEFSDFYEFYILSVEYQGAGKSGKNPAYEEKTQECMEKMTQICEDTPYPDLVPHYEYLIQLLENVDTIKE